MDWAAFGLIRRLLINGQFRDRHEGFRNDHQCEFWCMVGEYGTGWCGFLSGAVRAYLRVLGGDDDDEEEQEMEEEEAEEEDEEEEEDWVGSVLCAFSGASALHDMTWYGKLGTLVADNWHITVRVQTYWTLHLYVNPNTGDIIIIVLDTAIRT
jgi:hypothetical protein